MDTKQHSNLNNNCGESLQISGVFLAQLITMFYYENCNIREWKWYLSIFKIDYKLWTKQNKGKFSVATLHPSDLFSFLFIFMIFLNVVNAASHITSQTLQIPAWSISLKKVALNLNNYLKNISHYLRANTFRYHPPHMSRNISIPPLPLN